MRDSEGNESGGSLSTRGVYKESEVVVWKKERQRLLSAVCRLVVTWLCPVMNLRVVTQVRISDPIKLDRRQ